MARPADRKAGPVLSGQHGLYPRAERRSAPSFLGSQRKNERSSRGEIRSEDGGACPGEVEAGSPSGHATNEKKAWLFDNSTWMTRIARDRGVIPGGPKRGLASLLRPHEAAPGMPFAYCRYVAIRTSAATIIAAACAGGSTETSVLLAISRSGQPG